MNHAVIGFLVALVVVLCGLLWLALTGEAMRMDDEIDWRNRYVTRLEDRITDLEEALAETKATGDAPATVTVG